MTAVSQLLTSLGHVHCQQVLLNISEQFLNSTLAHNRLFSAMAVNYRWKTVSYLLLSNALSLGQIPYGNSLIFGDNLISLKHTHTQPFYGSVEFVRENPGEPVPEETFTHYSHRSHQSSLSAFSI